MSSLRILRVKQKKAATTRRLEQQAFRSRASIPTARGFSLVELMVAMAIGIIILIAVVQIFGSSRNTYRVDQGLSRLQENARYAMDTMTREIRQAGSMGCLSNSLINASSGGPTIHLSNDLNTTNGTDAAVTGFEQGLIGYEFAGTGPGSTFTPAPIPPNTDNDTSNGWIPQLDPSIVQGGKATPGSDMIIIYHVGANPIPLKNQPAITAASLFLPATDSTGAAWAPGTAPYPGEIAFLTDCTNADLFQISSVSTSSANITLTHAASGTPGNACVSWGTSAGCTNPPTRYNQNNTSLYTVTESAFFVAQDPNNLNDGPGLWEATSPYNGTSLTATEIAHGVDNLQILYGLDTDSGTGQDDGTAEGYYTADQVNAMPPPPGAQLPWSWWPKVVSVRFSLLMRTTNIVGSATDTIPDTGNYLLNGTDPKFATTINQSQVHDDLRRRVFTATVSLRNRSP